MPNNEILRPQAATKRRPRLLDLRVRLRLLLNMGANGGLEIIERERRFARSRGRPVAAELIDVGERLTVARDESVAPGLIFLHPETSMLNADKRNELAAVVFDEKDVVITHLELGRIRDFHRPAINRAAEHANRVAGARIALERVVDLESHEGDDAMLGAFSDPLRLEASHFTFENNLCSTNELIEIGRNNSGRVGDETDRKEDWVNEESDWLFHFRELGVGERRTNLRQEHSFSIWGFRSLLQIVNLHQPDARAPIRLLHDGGVIPGWDRGDERGFL